MSQTRVGTSASAHHHFALRSSLAIHASPKEGSSRSFAMISSTRDRIFAHVSARSSAWSMTRRVNFVVNIYEYASSMIASVSHSSIDTPGNDWRFTCSSWASELIDDMVDSLSKIFCERIEYIVCYLVVFSISASRTAHMWAFHCSNAGIKYGFHFCTTLFA